MSRYITVDDITFVDASGKNVKMKDRREIEQSELKLTLSILADDDLDEIASRPSVFGSNGEILTYRLFDQNVIEIVEGDFELTRNTIKVPV